MRCDIGAAFDQFEGQLTAQGDGGNFRPAKNFEARQATLTCTIDGARLLMLPFEATVPDGVVAYTIDADRQLQSVSTIAAHQPVLVLASGEVSFNGAGTVGYATSPLADRLRGTYCQQQLYAGDYVLGQSDGHWGLARLTADSQLQPFDVYACVSSAEAFLPFDIAVDGIADVWRGHGQLQACYNLMGQKTAATYRGIVIKNGRKYLNK